MILSKSAWYSKAYYFIQSWWAFSRNQNWDGRRYEDKSIVDSDICTFMRAYMVKLPILIFAHLFMYWMLFFTFIQFPITYLGLSSYFVTVMVVAGIIGLGTGAYFGERKLSCYLDSRPSKSKPVRTDPTFLELFCAWIRARHDKVCVLMTFKDEESKDD